MPAPTTDLWPEFQAPEAINSPVFFLKEQAAALQKKTRGLVRAGMRSASTADGSFWVGFDLYSPALGEYSYRLFEVSYPPEFFPITLTAADGPKTAKSLAEFTILVETVIRSPRTKQVIEAIMAQATALGPAGDENADRWS